MKDSLWIRFIGLTASVFIRVLYFSCRKRFIDPHHIQNLFAEDKGFILAAFHNRNVFSFFSWSRFKPKGRKIAPLASASKDGGIAAWAMRGFGQECVRGSTNKKGFNAFKKIMRHLKAGRDVAMTPDGPRGPMYTVPEGVVLAAKMSGAPILPVSYQAKRRKNLNSWDKMIIPYFFSRVNFVYGPPIRIPKDCDGAELTAFADALRTSMLELGERAECFDQPE